MKLTSKRKWFLLMRVNLNQTAFFKKVSSRLRKFFMTSLYRLPAYRGRFQLHRNSIHIHPLKLFLSASAVMLHRWYCGETSEPIQRRTPRSKVANNQLLVHPNTSSQHSNTKNRKILQKLADFCIFYLKQRFRVVWCILIFECNHKFE